MIMSGRDDGKGVKSLTLTRVRIPITDSNIPFTGADSMNSFEVDRHSHSKSPNVWAIQDTGSNWHPFNGLNAYLHARSYTGDGDTTSSEEARRWTLRSPRSNQFQVNDPSPRQLWQKCCHIIPHALLSPRCVYDL